MIKDAPVTPKNKNAFRFELKRPSDDNSAASFSSNLIPQSLSTWHSCIPRSS